MFEYRNGKLIEVHDLDECLTSIKCTFDNMQDRIDSLYAENQKLRDAAYKDEELKNMKSKLNEMRNDYYRCFPISEKEDEAIKEWQKRHDEKFHGLVTGASGGRYSYHFVPTALGTSGVVRCSCGAEFEFQEIRL